MKKIRVIEKIAQSSGLAVLLMSTGLPPCLATKNATLASDKVNIVWQDISIKGKVVDKSKSKDID